MKRVVVTVGTRGFTLIELLVVIAIIGVLSAVVLTSLNTARMKARDTRRIQDLDQIRTALELYYHDKGYYPASPCGWDCNNYYHSYSPSSWAALETELRPYMPRLPVDPINTACSPWGNNCFSYAYGNVGRNTYADQYDLTAQLESTTHVQRCGARNWVFYFSAQPWCGSYSTQIYEASPR